MGFRIVPVAVELLTDLFTVGHQMPPKSCTSVKCTAGLPGGAEIVDARLTDDGRMVLFKYFHPSWDNCPPGCRVKQLHPEFTSYHDIPAPSAVIEG